MMRNKLLYIFVFYSILIILVSCSRQNDTQEQTKVGNLILNQGKIDQVQIYEGQQGIPLATFTDTDAINELLTKIKDLTVCKLTKETDIDFMIKGERLSEKGFIRVSLIEQIQPNGKSNGEFFIWSDGTLCIVDVITMYSAERTVSYLSNTKEIGIYEFLINKINDTKLRDEKMLTEYPSGWPQLEISCGDKIIPWVRGDSNFTGKVNGIIWSTLFGYDEIRAETINPVEIKVNEVIKFNADQVKGLNKPQYSIWLLNKNKKRDTFPIKENSITVPEEGEYIFNLFVDWGKGDNNISYWFKVDAVK